MYGTGWPDDTREGPRELGKSHDLPVQVGGPGPNPCSAGLRVPGLQEREPRALAGSCRPPRPARSQAGLPGSLTCVAVHVLEETLWGQASSGPPSSPPVLGVGARHQPSGPGAQGH